MIAITELKENYFQYNNKKQALNRLLSLLPDAALLSLDYPPWYLKALTNNWRPSDLIIRKRMSIYHCYHTRLLPHSVRIIIAKVKETQ